MPKVLVTDQIAQDGIDLLSTEAEVDVHLRPSPDELLKLIKGHEAIVVRSATKVTADVIAAANVLQVIGRAGSGVDNIDLDAATQRGIVVVNAPTGNTLSAAEHAMALMLAMARQLPEAYTSLRSGSWERQKFIGVELRGKTLGLLGLGQVGMEVARRTRGMEMRVIAHDPYVAQERAESLGVELLSQDEVLGQSDFISLHMRVTPQTRDMINDEQIAKMKRGARIINTARGELIDDAALLRALDSGQLAGAAIDVFREEPPGENPLLSHDKVIVTPHLGALTEEAQERAATDVAEQVLAVLRGEPARYAVNAPLVSEETMKVLRPFFEVAERIASIATQISDGQLKAIEIEYLGEIANHDTTPLKAAMIKGLLAPVSEENVTIVNASLIAEQRGLRITERSGPSEEYTNLLTIKLETDVGVTTIAGSVFHDSTHIERVNDFWVDIPLDSHYLLICQNQDRPGMVGAVGAFIGEQDINISFMKVGREKVRGNALMVMGLDDEISPELLRKLESVPGLHSARLAKL